MNLLQKKAYLSVFVQQFLKATVLIRGIINELYGRKVQLSVKVVTLCNDGGLYFKVEKLPLPFGKPSLNRDL